MTSLSSDELSINYDLKVLSPEQLNDPNIDSIKELMGMWAQLEASEETIFELEFSLFHITKIRVWTENVSQICIYLMRKDEKTEEITSKKEIFSH